MTWRKREIMEMAREAGLLPCEGIHPEDLKAFAKLVREDERNRPWTQEHWTEYERSIAAQEREACAKVCDDKHDTWRWDNEPDSASGPRDCAAAIRARSGEQK